MSKLGKAVDRILELLNTEDKITVNELKKRAPLIDTEILDFMNQQGLIELRDGKISITEFGSLLKSVE